MYFVWQEFLEQEIQNKRSVSVDARLLVKGKWQYTAVFERINVNIYM